MSCLILKFYVEEENINDSVETSNPTIKIKKKPKKLSDGAIRLYERIVFRSKIYGYCFEMDKAFAKEFDVSLRTIKRRMKELREFGMIKCHNKIVNLKTTRKIYPLSNNVCGRAKSDTSGRVKNGLHNDIPIKEERMNAAEESSSSSLDFNQQKASPTQDLMKHYENWCSLFGKKLCPVSYRRWRKDGKGSYLDSTLRGLHMQYKNLSNIPGKLEKLIESALKYDYYGCSLA